MRWYSVVLLCGLVGYISIIGGISLDRRLHPVRVEAPKPHIAPPDTLVVIHKWDAFER